MRKLPEALILAAVLVFSSCSYVIREDHLFHPRKQEVLSDKLRRRNIEIPVGADVTLRGWLVSSNQHRRALIFFYGNAGTVIDAEESLYWLAENFQLNILAIDYRGYGFSDGIPAIETIASDSLRIFDHLHQSIYHKKQPVFVYGESLGTLFAVQVAHQRPVAGLILAAPPTSAKEQARFWKRSLPWPARWFGRLKFEKELEDRHPQPIEAIREIKAPLLVIHGAEDQSVPLEMGYQMYQESASSKKIWCPVAGGGHEDLEINGPAVKTCLANFFEDIQ